MARLGGSFPVILSGLILVPVILFVSLWLYWSATNVSSKIVDFHPSYFQAKADADFFYSIGDELKYSDQFDSQSPTLSFAGCLARPLLEEVHCGFHHSNFFGDRCRDPLV